MTMLNFVRKGLVAGVCLTMTACVTPMEELPEAEVNPTTSAQYQLKSLPGPDQKIAVAVYGFEDQTGQFKPSSTTQTLSRAVTQGPSSILVKALQDAGNRRWFDVVERENLEHLLNERQIITEMRQRYLGEQGVNPQALPPLMFAGVLMEGGIISYDTNTRTGGLGARYLGVGGSTEYREDTVTVYLRAVSTKTGEVLSNVTTQQRIASVGIAANAFRYVAFKELLEVDAGITANQPTQLAVQQAIEKAVYALIVEGAMSGTWSFGDDAQGQAVIENYRAHYTGNYPANALDHMPELAKAVPAAPAVNGGGAPAVSQMSQVEGAVLADALTNAGG